MDRGFHSKSSASHFYHHITSDENDNTNSVNTFSLISAWLLFVLGVFNVCFGLIFGSTIREIRSFLPSGGETPALAKITRNFRRNGDAENGLNQSTSTTGSRKVFNISAPVQENPAPPYIRPNEMEQRNPSIFH